MQNTNSDIIISEGRRPFWQVAVASLCFTGAIVAIGFFILGLFYTHGDDIKGSVSTLKLSLLLFVAGVRFSVVNNVCLDLINSRFKKEISVGMFRFGKWENLPNVEYVCVFRQSWSKDGDGDGQTDSSGITYDVNVWYNTSKHFTIYSNQELAPAYEMAKHIAVKLNADFLDSSVPGDKKWVEL